RRGTQRGRLARIPRTSWPACSASNRSSAYGSAVHRLYWTVTRSVLQGVIENIRPRLVALVDAKKDGVEPDEKPSSAEGARHAVEVAVHGNNEPGENDAGRAHDHHCPRRPQGMTSEDLRSVGMGRDHCDPAHHGAPELGTMTGWF